MVFIYFSSLEVLFPRTSPASFYNNEKKNMTMTNNINDNGNDNNNPSTCQRPWRATVGTPVLSYLSFLGRAVIRNGAKTGSRTDARQRTSKQSDKASKPLRMDRGQRPTDEGEG
jgi:hypothetical protein